MNKFSTLFKMQIKEKLDLSFFKDKKKTLFKVVFSLLGFAIITVISYLILWLCMFLKIFSPINQIPLSVMSVVFLIVFLFSLISCTISLTKTLYYTKDNQVLITFPVNVNLLFVVKLCVYALNEIKKSFTMIIPIFFAYGLISGMPILYYIWMPVMLTIFSAVIVLLGGILSIPTALVMGFLDKFKIIKSILTFIVLTGAVILVILLVDKIPADINLITSARKVTKVMRSFLTWFTDVFYIFYAFVIFLCGKFVSINKVQLFTEYSYIVFLIMLAAIVVLFGINYFLSRPIYLKAISSKFEFKKSDGKPRKNKVISNKFTAVIYENLKNIRDNGTINSSLIVLILSPIAIFALNKIYGAINTRVFGDFLTVAFNILIILLFALSHNINVSSIYSRDGGSLYISKVLPQKAFPMLVSRLGYNLFASIINLIITVPIFLHYSTLDNISATLLFFSILFLTITHIIWSAEIDFLHPQIDLFRTEGNASKNPNEIKSIILAFALSLLCFGVVVFLTIKSANYVWLKLFFITLFLLVFRFMLFRKKAKVMFKESML